MNGRTAKLLRRATLFNKREGRRLKKAWNDLPWMHKNPVRRILYLRILKDKLKILRARVAYKQARITKEIVPEIKRSLWSRFTGMFATS